MHFPIPLHVQLPVEGNLKILFFLRIFFVYFWDEECFKGELTPIFAKEFEKLLSCVTVVFDESGSRSLCKHNKQWKRVGKGNSIAKLSIDNQRVFCWMWFAWKWQLCEKKECERNSDSTSSMFLPRHTHTHTHTPLFTSHDRSHTSHSNQPNCSPT